MRLPSLLEPFWACATMTGECLFFVGEDERATATLLFPPERDIRIASADGATLYEEGRDYVVDYEAGSVERLLGSRVPLTSPGELHPPLAGLSSSAMRRRGDADCGLMFAEGDLFHRRQVAAPEVAVVQRRAVHAGPSQPGGNGGMAVAEHPHGRRNIQSFRQRRQHFCDAR